MFEEQTKGVRDQGSGRLQAMEALHLAVAVGFAVFEHLRRAPEREP